MSPEPLCGFSLKEHELSPRLHVSHYVDSGAGEEKAPRSKYTHRKLSLQLEIVHVSPFFYFGKEK